MSPDDRLLREYIRAVLTEDDGGVYGDLAMFDATHSPWGVSFGSGDDLFNIFVRPFTDVIQTAAGKTKELSQKGQTLVRVAFEAIATTLIPVLTDSYNEIFEHEKEKIDKIRGEYGEVYQSNWDAFKDEDFQFLMFLYNPARYINTKILKKSPQAALTMLGVLTGGTLDRYLDKVRDMFNIGKDAGPHRDTGSKNVSDVMGGMGGGYDAGWGDSGGHHGAMEGVIREDEQGNKPSLAQVLNNPKLLEKVNSSPIVQKMKRDAEQAIRQPLAQVFKQAQAVLRANSLQDLQQKLGKRLKGIEKLNHVEPQARQVAEQQLLAGVKKSMKTFYIKSLEKQAKQFAGSSVEQDYKSVIGKIKGL
jgi:hypothetical protein